MAAIFSPSRPQLKNLVEQFGLPGDAFAIVADHTIREYCSHR